MKKHRLIARAALAALTLLAVSACNQKAKTEKPSDKPPATVAPLAFANKNADAEVTLTLPEPIKLFPDLHTRLYTEGEKDLKAFMADAHKARTDQATDGIDVPAYYKSVNWRIAAQSPRLLSLFAELEVYEGGAHPNSVFDVRLWDKSKKELINTAKLFATGADMKALDAYVCHQVEVERSKRLHEPTTQAASGFACPKFADSRLILIPSTVTGKIGAIDALYAPYEVGPYAEGSYEIRVPQSQLQGLVNPDFADQFAGEAIKDNALPDPVDAPTH